ncbi:MAG: aldo/keto reductase [Hydrogenophaga sp.]|uniref:aldo/keto reductase n=1 Tax=Hydrogenophaga sp. TaxID=1904254 RepID=UPI0027301832|nr:aldo/keto reductase [Hydrogenophaga sp.]MDP2164684.1 aldo/keto reductase [Hydrogenophaga sp.]
MKPAALMTGHATRAGTEAYIRTYGAALAEGHYSDFLNLHLKLSSLGLGTFPGAASDEADECYAQIVQRALASGINVIDTAAHYRYGRSACAVGEGLRRAFAAGVARNQVFVISKGGFLRFADGMPEDFDAWFETHIARKGLGRRDDLTDVHLLSPGYIAQQIEDARAALGLETLDAFLVDQPEVHIPRIGKGALNRKLQSVFTVLEQAVKENKIRCYGISTFNGFRVETDHDLFQSLTSLQGLAEKAAQVAWQDMQAKHSFRLVQLPFNQAMLEGFTRFNQATGKGNVASTLQAAFQLRIYAMASHSLAKGRLAAAGEDALRGALPQFANPAQRALQFNRSTPGLGTSLAGISMPAHLDDLLEVARIPPLAREAYLKFYQRVDPM